jgi:hypothetical protein
MSNVELEMNFFVPISCHTDEIVVIVNNNINNDTNTNDSNENSEEDTIDYSR